MYCTELDVAVHGGSMLEACRPILSRAGQWRAHMHATKQMQCVCTLRVCSVSTESKTRDKATARVRIRVRGTKIIVRKIQHDTWLR
jgi:hypothetical protein